VYVGGSIAAIVGEIRSSVNRAASGSDGESVGAVIVMEGTVLRLLISSVGTPFVGVANSGMSAVVERERPAQV